MFLRILEYYEGILILTTNRVSTFDQAFKSRIHFAIQYSELDRDCRRNIWQTFLGKFTLHGDTGDELPALLDEMATTVLNGRQIRNVVHLAHALSLSEAAAAAGGPQGIRSAQVRDALAAMTAFELDFGEGTQTSSEEDSGGHRLKRRRVGG